jgi:HlyD family secretion protein
MDASCRLIVRMGALVFAATVGSSLAQQSDPVPGGPARTTGGPVSGIDTRQGLVVSCRVERGAKILWLLPDRTLVKRGDLVCELDDADLKDKLIDQTIALKRAGHEAKIAQLGHEAAVRDLEEYEKSTYMKDRVEVQREIKLAESRLTGSTDQVDESNKLWEQGKLSKAQKVAAELAFQETKFALELSQHRLNSLENFTKPNTIKRLRAEIVVALSREEAAKEIADLQRARAEKTRLQIENCRLTAPADGRLLYVLPPGSEGLREGDAVRERQPLFRIISFGP